jgi:protoheme ferro-lyase
METPSLLSDFRNLHDKGANEVLLSLYPQHAMWFHNRHFSILPKNCAQKHFLKIVYNVPAFYNKPDYLKNLADSIKGHLAMIMITYHSPIIVPELPSKTDINPNPIVNRWILL